MRGRVGSAAAFALLATACTAIVAGELNKYDDFKVSDTFTPGGNNGDKGGDPCALTTPDAANTCSTCIAQNCAPDIAYACLPDGSTKPWFDGLQECAQHPYQGLVGSSYAPYDCQKFDNPDAQPLHTGDDNEREQAALLCVRDHCLNSGTPPCHQCVVMVEKPGSAGGYAKLEDTDCGRCIRDSCGALLVKCCNDNLPEGLESCGYTGDQTYADKCRAAVHLDAGGPDARPNYVGAAQCAWDFAQTCLSSCFDRCPK